MLESKIRLKLNLRDPKQFFNGTITNIFPGGLVEVSYDGDVSTHRLLIKMKGNLFEDNTQQNINQLI
jgi:hypothetical protein